MFMGVFEVFSASIGFREGLLVFFLLQFAFFLSLLLKKQKDQASLTTDWGGFTGVILGINFLVAFLTGLYTVFTGTRISIFLVSTPLLFGVIIYGLRYEKIPVKVALFFVLVLGCLVVLSSFSIMNFHPIGADTPRFVAWGKKIVEQGRWIPNRNIDNPYYDNFFNAVPGCLAVINLVTGIGFLNGVQTIWSAFLTIVFGTSIFVAVEKLSGNKKAGLCGVLIAYTIPTLSTLPGVPQSVSYVFFAIFLALFASYLTEPRPHHVLLMILVGFAGIIFHPTFFIEAFSALLGTLIFSYVTKAKRTEFKAFPRVRGLVLTFGVIALAYWIHLALLNIIVNPAINISLALKNLLLQGEIYKQPIKHAYTKGNTPLYLALSWTFLPALGATYIGSNLIKKLKNEINHLSPSFYITVLGVVFLSLGFLNVFLNVKIPARYISYPGFALLIPGASITLSKLIKKTKRKKLTLLSIAGIVILISFSGLHAPAYSPDIHSEVRPGIGKTPGDWKVSNTIIKVFPKRYELEPHKMPKLGGALCYQTRIRMMDNYNRFFLSQYNYKPKGRLHLYSSKATPPPSHNIVYSGYRYIGSTNSSK